MLKSWQLPTLASGVLPNLDAMAGKPAKVTIFRVMAANHFWTRRDDQSEQQHSR
jgi:hypothetical protein